MAKENKTLTTNFGAPVDDDQNSMNAGSGWAPTAANAYSDRESLPPENSIANSCLSI